MEEKESRIFTISPIEDTLSHGHPSLSGDELKTDVQRTEPSPDVPPVLQGHVFKRSTSGIGPKMGIVTFKKRYFVLYVGVLLYYEHESSYERDKHQKLKHGKRILLEDLYLTHTTTHAAHHCFTLHVPHKDNQQKSYLLAMSDRKARNIWMEILQQQNPRLEPPQSEIDGHFKPVPSYINMIRTLPTPSPILRTKSHPQQQVHISELENYHYSKCSIPRNKSWSGKRPSGLLSSQDSRSSLTNTHSLSDSSSVHSLHAASEHEHRE